MNLKQFPDGTNIDSWFYNLEVPKLKELGKIFDITKYGVKDDNEIHTKEFQNVIDLASTCGGVIYVPEGTFKTGAIFLKRGVNVYLEENAVIKGSSEIKDYPVVNTRIEGESCLYISALINADNCDNLIIAGKGTIDGNGMNSWINFWKRREWNPNCTNKDEQRPRLLYVSNSNNVIISGVHLKDSCYWTSHFYKCNYLKVLNCKMTSPRDPIPAPSTDAIDLDVCSNVLIKNCYIEVNDDAIALKGGKGPYANISIDNGINEKIIIEDCVYGFCHGCLTCGSESVHNKNIIVRNIKVFDAINVLWLKMRPDTDQKYEYIELKNINAKAENALTIKPWTQFYDLKDRKDKPLSYANNIKMANCNIECNTFINVENKIDEYELDNFKIENATIKCKNSGYINDLQNVIKLENVKIDEKE